MTIIFKINEGHPLKHDYYIDELIVTLNIQESPLMNTFNEHIRNITTLLPVHYKKVYCKEIIMY